MSLRRASAVLPLLFLCTGLALGQEQGVDSQTQLQPPVLYTSVVDRMSQLLAGRSTEALSACSFTATITLGVPVTGQLDSSDCMLTSSYADFYVFAGVKGQSVTVTYTSADLSPLLGAIQDYSSGTVLTSGNGPSPLVFTYVPPTTTNYVIGVTSLKGTFSTGSYTLLVATTTTGGSVNLVPYMPSGWDSPVVVSTGTGTHSNSTTMRTTDTLYVDYAITNTGSSAISQSFQNNLYLDGVLKRQGTSSGLPLGSYVDVEDYSIGSLTAGTHTVRLLADATNAVPESNEGDNDYVKTFTVTSGTGPGSCTPTTTNLCLSAGRFKVEVTWESTTASGAGTAVGLTADSGYFTFFDPGNIELVVKVLNACSFSSHIWVFVAGLTNVRVVITVTDTATGVVKVYTNLQGVAFLPVQDTSAFATCP